MKKIIVNQKKCIGCGMCTIIVPKVFGLGKNGRAVVINQDTKFVKKINEAISTCPGGAISYKKGQ